VYACIYNVLVVNLKFYQGKKVRGKIVSLFIFLLLMCFLFNV